LKYINDFRTLFDIQVSFSVASSVAYSCVCYLSVISSLTGCRFRFAAIVLARDVQVSLMLNVALCASFSEVETRAVELRSRVGY